MAIKLTDFLPSPEELTPDQVLEARRRLQTVMSEWWPELDTRPNSPFGDLHMTPLAILLAGIEVAADRVFSDLNLGNVARGVIFNELFVESFLQNFGVSRREPVPASGTLRFTFSANQAYAIDSNSTFRLGGGTFLINKDEGDPVMIFPVGSTSGKRVLKQIGQDRFVVYLPVTGTPGTVVGDSVKAAHDLVHGELITVEAAGSFDSGLSTESLSQLAAKAQRTFIASGLTSRGAAVSFALRRWPQLIGVSATVVGDSEMIREGETPLGVKQGALDLFIKSRTSLAQSSMIATLTYDTNEQVWLGRLDFPTPPAFFGLSTGVFQVNNFRNAQGKHQVFSKSAHPLIDSPGLSYSKFETLGIKITDTNATDFQDALLTDVETVVSNGTLLDVSGEFTGSVFQGAHQRTVLIRFDSLTTLDGLPAVQANVKDEVTGDTATVFFVPDNVANPKYGIVAKTTQGYKDMLNGLDLKIVPTTSTFVPANVLGFSYRFSFRGKTANFEVNYLFDPFLTQADNIVQDPDNKPVNVTPLARSFIPCHISEFTVNFRAVFGIQVNVNKARTEIFEYLSRLTHPYTYEDSTVGRILEQNGASGVISITKTGIFYPSIANVFVQKDGTEVVVPRFVTKTLLPETNAYGFGRRNVNYLIEEATIKFNGTTI